MAENTTIKYVSQTGLQYYDQKLKAWVNAADNAVKSELQAKIDEANTAIQNEATTARANELTLTTAVQEAKAAADAAQEHSEALAEKVGTVEDGKTVMGIIAQIQAEAYDDKEVRGLIAENAEAIEALEGTHNTDKSNLEAAIALKADKTALEAEAETARAAEEANASAIEALTGVVGANKTAIEGTVATLEAKVDENESDIEAKMTALTERVAANETAVGTTLPNAIATEKTAREEADADLDERLVKVETFFETAEGESLDTALDTLVEIQKYLDGEGEVADQMLLDIAANKKAIEDHVATNHDFAGADAALKAELEEEIAKKADSTTVEAMDAAYKAADEAIKGRLNALEGINHDAYIAADTALKNELNAAIALKANQSALEEEIQARKDADSALETTVKTYVDGLNTAMDARVQVVEGKAHVHANAEELAKIASGDVAKWNAAEQNAKDYADQVVADSHFVVNFTPNAETMAMECNKTYNEILEAQNAGKVIIGYMYMNEDRCDLLFNGVSENRASFEYCGEGSSRVDGEAIDNLTGLNLIKLSVTPTGVEYSLATIEFGETRKLVTEAKDLVGAINEVAENVGAVDLSGIATNAAAIEALAATVETKADASVVEALAARVGDEETKSANFESRLAELEAVKHEEVSTDFIDGLF